MVAGELFSLVDCYTKLDRDECGERKLEKSKGVAFSTQKLACCGRASSFSEK